MAPFQYNLFQMPVSTPIEDPRQQSNRLVRLPREIFYTIIDYVAMPDLNDRADGISSEQDETLADIYCLALTSKAIANEVLVRRSFRYCDDLTKDVIWRDYFLSNEFKDSQIRDLWLNYNYPQGAVLWVCERRRREWLAHLGGRRLGEWVMQDVKRRDFGAFWGQGLKTQMWTITLLFVSGMVAGVAVFVTLLLVES